MLLLLRVGSLQGCCLLVGNVRDDHGQDALFALKEGGLHSSSCWLVMDGASVESVHAAGICISPLPHCFRSVVSEHDNALPLILFLLNEYLDRELCLQLLQSGATLSDDTPHGGDRDREAQFMRVRKFPGSNDSVWR